MDERLRPAFYAARVRRGRGRLADWWTVLHPPYTAWHLSYVVIGACLAPTVEVSRLVATVLAFFFAVGIAAHALDELRDRPLRTAIPSSSLMLAVVLGLGGAVALGAVGVGRVGWPLVPFIVIGPFLVAAYNAEWWGGVVHNAAGFAAGWGAFPVLTAYVAQTGRLSWGAVLVAGAAFGLSVAQRALSTQARLVRRRSRSVAGEVVLDDGSVVEVDARFLLAPLEEALRVLSWSLVLLATGIAVARLG